MFSATLCLKPSPFTYIRLHTQTAATHKHLSANYTRDIPLSGLRIEKCYRTWICNVNLKKIYIAMVMDPDSHLDFHIYIVNK